MIFYEMNEITKAKQKYLEEQYESECHEHENLHTTEKGNKIVYECVDPWSDDCNFIYRIRTQYFSMTGGYTRGFKEAIKIIKSKIEKKD